jgi:signal transduction histidine kinase
MAPVDLNGIVSEGLVLLRREMADNRVTLRLDLAPGLPPVRGDKVQLQQVVINLAINGVQAMAGLNGRPRELFIRSWREDGGPVQVQVRDSGAGIAPSIAGRLFDPFYTTKPDGMGMGLSICRTIIDAHGGRIWAAADPGSGADFRFSLPAAGA